jgi:hypothetical protein
VGKASGLLSFAKEVFKLKFADKPNYTKLSFLLSSVLLADDVAPDLDFDWSCIPSHFYRSKPGAQSSDRDDNDAKTEEKSTRQPIRHAPSKIDMLLSCHILSTKASSDLMRK